MGLIPISMYSSGSREGWVGYLYPCIAQSLGKKGLDPLLSQGLAQDGFDTYILV